MNYTQLTREQRYQIYALKKADHSQAEMAAIIGVHKSTISSELARNGGQRGYRPKRAQETVKSRTDQWAAQAGAARERQPRALHPLAASTRA